MFRYTDGRVNTVCWSADESTYYLQRLRICGYGMQTLLRNPNSDGNDLINNTNHIGANGAGPRIEVDSGGKFTIHNPDNDPNVSYDLHDKCR